MLGRVLNLDSMSTPFPRFFRAKRGRRPSGARNWVGKKKSEQKKRWTKKKVPRRRRRRTTNFVPGQTIHFLVEVFAFLSFFQPSKTFSYVSHFHNLSKRNSEKIIFAKTFLWKQKKIKKNFFFFRFYFFSNFFSIFFLCPKPTQHLFLSILL